MSADTKRPGEFELIARYLAPLAYDETARGLIDDAAALTPPPGCDLVLTKDALAAGVHFFADDAPATIAHKALRVNLSDLAAKGARPLGYLMAIALPADWTEQWFAGFTAGLRDDQARYGVSLFGGDTIRSGDGLMISVTAIGAVPHGGMIPRGGAGAGDRIYVSGTIGDAGLGLRLRRDPQLASRLGLTADEAGSLVDRFLVPRPRVELAEAVRENASAAMDVSDGLAGDLGHMCRASGLAARLDLADVPMSFGMRRAIATDPSLYLAAIPAGDDYDLIVAVPPARCAAFEAAAGQAGCAVTCIGGFEVGAPEPAFVGEDGAPVPLGTRSYTHF